jgi:selenocysteine lyase/cysteine desulfurase
MMTIDVAAARALTPGCQHVAHLNNAGSALPTSRTLDVVVEHLRREALIGGYEAEAEARERLVAARATIGRLLNAAPEEIAITGSDSMSWIKAFWGFVFGGGLRSGDVILTDRASYNSHYLAFLQAVRTHGVRIQVMPTKQDGALDTASLAAALHDGVKLISATFVANNSGAVHPVHEVGRVAKSAGIPFFLDACQAVGQLAVDVEALGCDVLTATGRKFLRGPRGTGILFVRRAFADRCDPPGIDGTSSNWVDGTKYVLAEGAQRFDEFETPVAARLGLGAAVAEALELGIDAISARALAVAEGLRARLVARGGVEVLDGSGPRSAIVTFRIAGRRADEIVARARAAGVHIGASHAVWTRLDMTARGLTEHVRASPHYYNTEEELDRLIAAIG